MNHFKIVSYCTTTQLVLNNNNISVERVHSMVGVIIILIVFYNSINILVPSDSFQVYI